jgi:hypothetical protein|tara:strand:+ start:379 stop:624 length:246 start_codon:yes stop_codon:yes gene_type:complete
MAGQASKQSDEALWRYFASGGTLPLAMLLFLIALQAIRIGSSMLGVDGADTIPNGRLTRTQRSSIGTDLLIQTTRSGIDSK